MFSFQSAQEHKNRYRFKILSFFSWYPVKVPLRKRCFSEGMMKWDFLCSSSEIYYFPVSLTRFSSIAKVDCVSQCFNSFTTYRQKWDRRSSIRELFYPFNLNTRCLRCRARVSNIIFLFMLSHTGVRVAREPNKENERRLWKTFQSHNAQWVLFSSILGVVLVVDQQKKLHIALFRPQKVFELQLKHPAEHDTVEVRVLPSVGWAKRREKRVYGLNPSSEKFTVKISWLFFFLQMDSHIHTEQGPFRGMNQ